MIKILFNNEVNCRELEFSRDNDNVITLRGDVPDSAPGFKAFRLSGEPLGDFSDYTTVYRKIEGGAQYSNDGSVWVEPEIIEPPEQPETQPTQEQRIAQLEEQLAAAKILLGVE